ncbi:hypothetical protein B0H14DRAFT_2410571, partial [Mycena olivaceomarginata]
EWDGWPDGNFTRTFPLDFVEAHENLRVHWACQTLGGSVRGRVQAETWKEGKITRRLWLGIIECTNSACNVIVRPQTRAKGLEKQLSRPCSCGAALTHHPCGVISFLHTFQNGVHYQNVEQNPSAGPLKLLVGRPGVHGPGESMADISPVLFNAERIKYERRRILKGARRPGGDSFSEAFARFEEKHPGFILESQFADVSVIVMQTPFMLSKLVKSVIDDDAVNGIVSDAAHGFWQERNGILIISSTFEPDRLKCWVPGVMSYSNGGTADHYRIHFVHLFMRMARECVSREIEVTDGLFANVSTHFLVVDFSGAQRNGFILAFVDFWLEHAPGERGIDELLATAPTLLKGCAQHFRNQSTRVKKISGVVDPSKADIFQNYAQKLLLCKNMDEFTSHTNAFIAAFPRAASWIRWWMLPAHATMLFPALYERTAREYEFEWLECNDGTLFHSSDDLDIPPLMLRIFTDPEKCARKSTRCNFPRPRYGLHRNLTLFNSRF